MQLLRSYQNSDFVLILKFFGGFMALSILNSNLLADRILYNFIITYIKLIPT